MEYLREKLNGCKTDRQVLKLLEGRSDWKHDDESEKCYGVLDIRFDNGWRIYYSKHRREYILQAPMQAVKLTYSGAPMFSGSKSYF